MPAPAAAAGAAGAAASSAPPFRWSASQAIELFEDSFDGRAHRRVEGAKRLVAAKFGVRLEESRDITEVFGRDRISELRKLCEVHGCLQLEKLAGRYEPRTEVGIPLTYATGVGKREGQIPIVPGKQQVNRNAGFEMLCPIGAEPESGNTGTCPAALSLTNLIAGRAMETPPLLTTQENVDIAGRAETAVSCNRYTAYHRIDETGPGKQPLELADHEWKWNSI